MAEMKVVSKHKRALRSTAYWREFTPRVAAGRVFCVRGVRKHLACQEYNRYTINEEYNRYTINARRDVIEGATLSTQPIAPNHIAGK